MLPKALLFAATGVAATASAPFRTSLKLSDLRAQSAGDVSISDTNPALLYPAYNLSVPIDHFHNESIYEPHSNATFNLRYWFDATYYKPGGPIVVLQGGETSGEDRLPFLQKGIVAQLIQGTNGLGVILEHRYYGTSFPLDDLSTESFRFLTTEQSVADMAYFAENIVFPGLEHLDLTAPSNPYIAYGGSYAGGFVAILRKIYPDVYWGAIASSAVTVAILDYWQYNEAPRLFAPAACVSAMQKVIDVVDKILIGHKDSEYVQRLKNVFGLSNLTRIDDFASTVSIGIGGMQQYTNWDPAVNSTSLGTFCNEISSPTLVYSNSGLKAEVQELLEVAGYGDELDTLTTGLLNYIGYVGSHVVSRCRGGATQDQCFTNYNTEFYKQDDITQTWRAWAYQYCTEWGYFVTGSGVPQDQLPLVSRLVDLEYNSVVCKEAFNLTTPPDLERINKYGGFEFSYPRLAFIDGQADPWRAATPHAIGLPERPDTDSEPFVLIDLGVHHWDENGLFPNQTTPDLPPKSVAHAQARELEFVKAWMKAWKSRTN